MQESRASNKTTEHFLVIGAGASLGAREGRKLRPPLGANLAAYLSNWLRANDYDRLCALQQCKAIDRMDATVPSRDAIYTDDNEVRTKLHSFLDRVGRLEKQQRNRSEVPQHAPFELVIREIWDQWNDDPKSYSVLDAVNRLVGWSFCTGTKCAFPYGTDAYDKLARRFDCERTAVISLNYDVLFEEAWQRDHGANSLHYPGLRRQLEATSAGAPVYKLHGSINWFKKTGGSPSPDPAIAEKNAGPASTVAWSDGKPVSDSQQEHAVLGSRTNLVLEMKCPRSFYHPIVASYAAGKPVIANYPSVEAARVHCADAIRDNPEASVKIIGVHVPSREDDEVLPECLKSLGELTGERVFINPSQQECDAASKLGFAPIRCKLREFLEQG